MPGHYSIKKGDSQDKLRASKMLFAYCEMLLRSMAVLGSAPLAVRLLNQYFLTIYDIDAALCNAVQTAAAEVVDKVLLFF